jgi:hypothetical protein
MVVLVYNFNRDNKNWKIEVENTFMMTFVVEYRKLNINFTDIDGGMARRASIDQSWDRLYYVKKLSLMYSRSGLQNNAQAAVKGIVQNVPAQYKMYNDKYPYVGLDNWERITRPNDDARNSEIYIRHAIFHWKRIMNNVFNCGIPEYQFNPNRTRYNNFYLDNNSNWNNIFQKNSTYNSEKRWQGNAEHNFNPNYIINNTQLEGMSWGAYSSGMYDWDGIIIPSNYNSNISQYNNIENDTWYTNMMNYIINDLWNYKVLVQKASGRRKMKYTTRINLGTRERFKNTQFKSYLQNLTYNINTPNNTFKPFEFVFKPHGTLYKESNMSYKPLWDSEKTCPPWYIHDIYMITFGCIGDINTIYGGYTYYLYQNNSRNRTYNIWEYLWREQSGYPFFQDAWRTRLFPNYMLTNSDYNWMFWNNWNASECLIWHKHIDWLRSSRFNNTERGYMDGYPGIQVLQEPHNENIESRMTTLQGVVPKDTLDYYADFTITEI